jgi:hypothetical protein
VTDESIEACPAKDFQIGAIHYRETSQYRMLVFECARTARALQTNAAANHIT